MTACYLPNRDVYSLISHLFAEYFREMQPKTKSKTYVYTGRLAGRYSNHLGQLLHGLIFWGYCSERKCRTLQSCPQWSWMEVEATQNQHDGFPRSSPESTCECGRKWDLKSVHKTIKSITAVEWPLITQGLSWHFVCTEAVVEGVTNWSRSLLNPSWQPEEYISKAKSHHFPWAHLTAG